MEVDYGELQGASSPQSPTYTMLRQHAPFYRIRYTADESSAETIAVFSEAELIWVLRRTPWRVSVLRENATSPCSRGLPGHPTETRRNKKERWVMRSADQNLYRPLWVQDTKVNYSHHLWECAELELSGCLIYETAPCNSYSTRLCALPCAKGVTRRA